LGGAGLGQLLVLGPQGNLVPGHLAYLRSLSARAENQGLAGQACSVYGRGRFLCRIIYILRGKLFNAGIAQLRLNCLKYIKKITDSCKLRTGAGLYFLSGVAAVLGLIGLKLDRLLQQGI
jgi:hypothetical protein